MPYIWLIRSDTARRRLGALGALVLAASVLPATAGSAPRWLSQTGLYAQGAQALAPGIVPFSPQYPLWSDGTSKRRWVYLPPGTHIDGSRPDAWVFPKGTKLWKEFAYGRRVETRYIERLRDGSWRFAVYVWREDGRDAELAPVNGVRALAVADAPGGKYVVPSQDDCRACHEGAAVPVLGFSALQLSPDRDPNAPHAEPASVTGPDLNTLAQQGLLRRFPSGLLTPPPRIQAASATERAALGYLHANCGHCHNDPRDSVAGVPVELLLAQYLARPDSPQAVRLSLHSLDQIDILTQRMRTRDPRTQMPPLGSQVPDSVGLSLIERWISQLRQSEKE